MHTTYVEGGKRYGRYGRYGNALILFINTLPYLENKGTARYGKSINSMT